MISCTGCTEGGKWNRSYRELADSALKKDERWSGIESGLSTGLLWVSVSRAFFRPVNEMNQREGVHP
jgi:hypothetical protein